MNTLLLIFLFISSCTAVDSYVKSNEINILTQTADNSTRITVALIVQNSKDMISALNQMLTTGPQLLRNLKQRVPWEWIQ